MAMKFWISEPPKVHLDLTLSTGRHLCLDNLRQCSDDAIEDITKNKTVMVRTYKGKDLLKIKCTHVSLNFSVAQELLLTHNGGLTEYALGFLPNQCQSIDVTICQWSDFEEIFSWEEQKTCSKLGKCKFCQL